jgi:PPOX class probable F420-dependent enzyme
MSREMGAEERRSFLEEGTRTGKVATVRADGRPHVAPIWFVLDGDDVVFSTWHSTVKAANIARDGRVAMVVDLEEPPYAFVLVEGTAELSDDLDELRRFATLIGGRYMGADQAEAFGERNAVPGERLVRLHVEKVVAIHEMST